MHRIILFLLLIALASAGAAWVADQGGDVVLSWDGWRVHTSLPVFALALGIVIVAAMLAWSLLRALWRAPEKIRRARARAASRARPPRHHPRPARDRPWRCRCRPRPRRARTQARRQRSAGAAAARAIRPAQRRPRRRATRVPRHGQTRRHAAVGPARPVHRGATIGRSGCRCHDRGRSADAGSELDLGLACRARIPLRQGRLERGAVDPREQSLLRPDRQGDVPAPARRAADGARAGTGNARPRPVARKRDGSGQARADFGAGRRARQQIRGRGASDAPRDALRRGGVARASASRSGGCLCACEAGRFRAPAAGAGGDAGRESARPSRKRACGGARRDRRLRIHPRPRGAGAVHRRRRRSGWRC